MRKYSAAEFQTLPFYPFDERSPSLQIDVEEARTAIFIAKGDINAAAALLKVLPVRLRKVIRKSLQLQRLCEDLRAA